MDVAESRPIWRVRRFNGSGVRERRLCFVGQIVHLREYRFNGSGVRERRLCCNRCISRHSRLVHASMGPASENAGYGGNTSRTMIVANGFNGSGVRERRLWALFVSACDRIHELQWVRRPRTPVMPAGTFTAPTGRSLASMGPASENAGYGRSQR